MKQRPSALRRLIAPGLWEDQERDAVGQRLVSLTGFFVKLDRPKVVETFNKLKAANARPDPKWIGLTGSDPGSYNAIRSPEHDAYFFIMDKAAHLLSVLTGKKVDKYELRESPLIYTKEMEFENKVIGDFVDTLVGHLLYRDSCHTDPKQIHLIFFV